MIGAADFRGMIPRRAPHLLPDPYAQTSVNCRMLNGNLIPLQGALDVQTFSGGPFKSIYWLNRQYWLRWNAIVDVAKSPILGDTTGRISYTSDSDVPRITNIALATATSSDVTTGTFVIAAVTASQTINVKNGPAFIVGNVLSVSDGTHSMTGNVTAVTGNALTVTTMASANVGATMATAAAVTSTDASTAYPLIAFKLGSPAPLVAASADYDFAQFVFTGTVDDCSSLTSWTITNYQEASAVAISAAGTGYGALDAIYVAGGTDSVQLILLANTVGGGGNITAASVANQGIYSVIPANPVSQANVVNNTGGPSAGTGANFNITWGAIGSVIVDAAVGNPLPSFKLTRNSSQALAAAFLYKDLGMDSPLSMVTLDVRLDAGTTFYSDTHFTVVVGGDADGNGAGIRFTADGGPLPTTLSLNLYTTKETSWGLEGQKEQNAQVLAAVASAGPIFFTIKILYEGESDTGFKYNVQVYQGVTKLMQSNLVSSIGPKGSLVGFKLSGNMLFAANKTANIDNVGVQNFANSTSIKAENYVFTYVTGLGEESAPSPVSNLIINGTLTSTGNPISNIITFPSIPQASEQTAYGTTYVPDYDIVGRRLYRSVTTSAGSTFDLVVDESVLTNSVTTYTDSVADADLGDVLPSDGWQLPPADAHDILSLPNGITAVASGNQLCLTPIGITHAFPDAPYRYPTDTRIVALGAIDTTIVVLTEAFPYIASGNDPTAFTMAKLEKSYGCVSKRSVAYLRQFGVVYASASGLIAIPGAGLRNLTQAYFTMENGAGNWLDLNPASFVATTRDDRYVGFCTPTGGGVFGFIFDPKEEGQAWSYFDLSPLLDNTQTAADGYYTDTITGDLYMIAGSKLQKFDAGDVLKMIWRSKIWHAKHSMANVFGRLRTLRGYDPSVTPITIKYIVDGVTVTTTVVQNNRPFTVAPVAGEELEFELSGKWTVEDVMYAEQIEEML